MTPDQLIGHTIGPLRIDRILGSGRDHEVFLARHSWTQRNFVLRLSVENPVWDEATPPRKISNVADELNNVQGSIAYNRMFWEEEPPKKPWWNFWSASDVTPFRLSSATLYGLAGERHLIALNEPRRLRLELDLRELIQKTSTTRAVQSLGSFRVFCDLLGIASLAFRSGLLPASYWQRDLVQVFASDLVGDVIRELWQTRSNLTHDDLVHATSALSSTHRDPGYPDPTQNLLLLIWAIANSRQVPSGALFATLSSKHFRVNVSMAEIYQVQRLLDFLTSAGGQLLGQDAVQLATNTLKALLETLQREALDAADFTAGNPGPFELRAISVESAKNFELIVQEFVGNLSPTGNESFDE